MNSRMLCLAMPLSLTLGQAAQARGPFSGRENHGRDARATSSTVNSRPHRKADTVS